MSKPDYPIILNGRPEREVVADLARAVKAKFAGRAFRHGSDLTYLPVDEPGAAPGLKVIRNEDARWMIEQATVTGRILKDGETTLTPTTEAHVRSTRKSLEQDPELRLPALDSITEVPLLRGDGTVLDKPGYDTASGVLYVPSLTDRIRVPAAPTQAQARAAAKFITDEVLVDFPFKTQADQANALAFLLTDTVRRAVPVAPAAVISAPTMGTGKDLFVRVVHFISTGREPGLTRWEDEAERRKHITAALRAGATFITFSNCTGTLRSPALEHILTSPMAGGRILGLSETVNLVNRATWSFNGNNIGVSGDLSRRTYPIRLDAEVARPYERTPEGGWHQPDLVEWVLQHRAKLIAAKLTILKAWVVGGRPAAPTEVRSIFGSFERWESTMSGALHFAGVEGFLADRADWLDDSEQETAEDGAFVAALLAWRRSAFTAKELLEALLPQLHGSPLRRAATPEIELALEAKVPALALGFALRRMVDVRYGPGEPWLSKGKDKHEKVASYRVNDPARLDQGGS